MSSGKTQHLQLNQWVLDDPYLMEEVNEDNRKIDEAAQSLQNLIDAMPYVKLMDITTTADAQQVDLNLSSIDLTKYAAIHIYSNAVVRDIPDNTANGHANLQMRINGLGGNTYPGSGGTNPLLQPYVVIIYQKHYSNCPVQITITGFSEQPSAANLGTYYHALSVNCMGGALDYVANQIASCNLGDSGSKLNHINFLASGDTGRTFRIKKNASFIVYGVKK